jgi:hypothetical protein
MSKPTRNYLSVQEAADFCGVTRQYLYQCRCNGKGPRCAAVYVKGAGSGPSKRLAYRKADLIAWNATRPKRKTKTKKAA